MQKKLPGTKTAKKFKVLFVASSEILTPKSKKIPPKISWNTAPDWQKKNPPPLFVLVIEKCRLATLSAVVTASGLTWSAASRCWGRGCRGRWSGRPRWRSPGPPSGCGSHGSGSKRPWNDHVDITCNFKSHFFPYFFFKKKRLFV